LLDKGAKERKNIAEEQRGGSFFSCSAKENEDRLGKTLHRSRGWSMVQPSFWTVMLPISTLLLLVILLLSL
jgi:hypothetical protein